MVGEIGRLCVGIEELKKIPICNLLYRVMLDTSDPLPKTKFGNKYVLMAIDHYSKWCETKPVKEHTIIVVAKFLEKQIICRFGVPEVCSY
jgi:hypothetical protein